MLPRRYAATDFRILGAHKGLRDDMVLFLSPHWQQGWHVNETELDYTFCTAESRVSRACWTSYANALNACTLT